MRNLITIIISTYNSGKTLRRCLESLAIQDFKSFDIILVDNCSEDNTLSIVESFKPKLNFTFIISEQDSGIYNAWNKGIKLIKTDWVCFLGSDDFLLHPYVFSSLSNILLHYPDVNFISARIQKSARIIGKKFSFFNLFPGMRVAHPLSLVKLKSMKRRTFDEDFKICSDYFFLFDNFFHIKPFFLNDTILQMGDSGVSSTLLHISYKEHLLYFRKKSPLLLILYRLYRLIKK